MPSKPTLCLDFDGVIHSYISPWKGPEVIPDPPVPGAMEFIWNAQGIFKIAIYSSRTNGGLWAMKVWLAEHMRAFCHDHKMDAAAEDILSDIDWPLKKPAAFLTIDDRAMTFTGTWPDPQELLKFKPWNRQ